MSEVLKRGVSGSRMLVVAAGVLFGLGLFLFGLNLAGLFLPLRGPGLEEEKTLFKDDITISAEEALSELSRRPGEPVEDYVNRAVLAVNRAMAHHWSERDRDKYRLRVPARENYLLWLQAFLDPDRYRLYEFADYRKAIERGLGLCSQQVLALAGALEENGVEAEIIVLGGHVVARVKVEDGRWITADPDYGLVIPHDVFELSARPHLVRRYYRGVEEMYREGVKGYSADELAEIYGPEGNLRIRLGVLGYLGPERVAFERRSYLAIWLLPAILCLPLVLLALVRLGRRRRENPVRNP